MAFTAKTPGVIPIQNTSAVFIATNPVLLYGQVAIETDTNRTKSGDGTSTYTQLTYAEWSYEIVESTGVDTYVGTFASPHFLAYFPMMRVRVRFASANTGAATINLGSKGAKAIKKRVSAALVLGDILAGGIYELLYDGTNFQMVSTSEAAGVGTVTSVSGTLNRITSTGGATPIIDISASYVGQTSITTLGTITAGAWTATAIGATFGGTGQTVYAVGDLLYANTTTTLAKLADVAAGRYLRSGGVGAAPLWSTNTLPNTTGVNQILYATSANVIGSSASFLFDGTNLGVGAVSGGYKVEISNGTGGSQLKFIRGTGVATIDQDNNTNNLLISATAGLVLNGASGSVVIGATTFISTELLSLQKSQNASTYLLVQNATAGASAQAAITLQNNSGFQLLMGMVSSTYAGAGIVGGDDAYIQAPSSNLSLGAGSGIFFYTGGTALTMWLTSVGNLKIGGVATRATTEGTAHLDIFNGTAPVGTLTNGVSLFSVAGVLKSINAAGLVGFVNSSTDGAAAPGTNAIGIILDYYGTSATRVLTTPNSWEIVTLNGTVYKRPLYL